MTIYCSKSSFTLGWDSVVMEDHVKYSACMCAVRPLAIVHSFCPLFWVWWQSHFLRLSDWVVLEVGKIMGLLLLTVTVNGQQKGTQVSSIFAKHGNTTQPGGQN